MITANNKHFPVMLNEVLEYLNPQDNKTYVDATFGNGGYSLAILQAAKCNLIAIDRDPNVLPRAREFEQQFGKRFTFIPGRFGNMSELISQPVDGFVFDIGVSSMQLDEPLRGFSFNKEAPLDMRMSCNGVSAADIVNSMEEHELADLIYTLGEEKKSRQIARKIALYRQTKKIETTTELAQIVCSVIKPSFNAIHPATRTFQALRIAVNDELQELKNGLDQATKLLNPLGRIVVVDFHSLEDRIVKNFFNSLNGKKSGTSRYMPQPQNDDGLIVFQQVSKAITPSQQECDLNPRSRSAKLRFAVKGQLDETKGGNNDKY